MASARAQQPSSRMIGNLLKAAAASWSFGATLATPIFQRPTLWYQRKAAIDTFDAPFANYRQTVLSGLVQLPTRSARTNTMRRRSRRNPAPSRQRRTPRVSSGSTTRPGGRITWMCSSRTRSISRRDSGLQARAQRRQDRVALFVALGGGWWNAPEAQHAGAGRWLLKPASLCLCAPGGRFRKRRQGGSAEDRLDGFSLAGGLRNVGAGGADP